MANQQLPRRPGETDAQYQKRLSEWQIQNAIAITKQRESKLEKQGDLIQDAQDGVRAGQVKRDIDRAWGGGVQTPESQGIQSELKRSLEMVKYHLDVDRQVGFHRSSRRLPYKVHLDDINVLRNREGLPNLNPETRPSGKKKK